jgi:hypothetical protein
VLVFILIGPLLVEVVGVRFWGRVHIVFCMLTLKKEHLVIVEANGTQQRGDLVTGRDAVDLACEDI